VPDGPAVQWKSGTSSLPSQVSAEDQWPEARSLELIVNAPALAEPALRLGPSDGGPEAGLPQAQPATEKAASRPISRTAGRTLSRRAQRLEVLAAAGRGRLKGDFVQPSAADVEDETANLVLLRHKRTRLDAGGRLPDILLQIGKGLKGE